MRMKLRNALPTCCDQNKSTVCAAIDGQERCLVYCVAAPILRRRYKSYCPEQYVCDAVMPVLVGESKMQCNARCVVAVESWSVARSVVLDLF